MSPHPHFGNNQSLADYMCMSASRSESSRGPADEKSESGHSFIFRCFVGLVFSAVFLETTMLRGSGRSSIICLTGNLSPKSGYRPFRWWPQYPNDRFEDRPLREYSQSRLDRSLVAFRKYEQIPPSFGHTRCK